MSKFITKGRIFVQSYPNIKAILNDTTLYPAHIRMLDDSFHVQTVEEHLVRTAEYAREALADIGLGNTAYLCGLLHDIGKFSLSFKKYITRRANGEIVRRGKVNHTFAGVRYILEEFHDQAGFLPVTSELIAYAIGAHHGEFDGFDPEKDEHGLYHRCTKHDPDIDEALAFFRKHFGQSKRSEIHSLMNLAAEEINLHLNKEKYDGKTRPFAFGLLARLLLSAVIEGDRRDTAEFMNDLTPSPYDHASIFSAALACTESHLSTFRQDSDIQKCRRIISDLCAEAAEYSEDGNSAIFRLDLPTGGGKTLSSLRYALHRAVKSGKKHILYVIPLLSILEQNAKEIRKAVGDDRIVFEHHSNVVSPEDSDEFQNSELLADTWDAPILITTLVQFLNTLFSYKTTSIRRFHSLADSIIILDEVQTVPLKMLSLFNAAVDFLAKNCGTEVILCSATQPAFELAHRAIRTPIQTMIPYRESLRQPFERTRLQYYDIMDNDSIAAFALDALQENDSLLIICNTKKISTQLYQKLKHTDADVYYLSTNLCMAHRRKVLENMYISLDPKNNRKTLCISTQVIEAGVDISFKRVIRLLAGLDSLVQAAGRCNRHGESDGLSEVSVIRCAEESLKMLPDIENGQKVVLRLLDDTRFKDDLTSQEAIRRYYQILYKDSGLSDDFQDYYVKACKNTLYDMLAENRKFRNNPTGYYLNQAFLTAGKHFQVFETESEDIVVPYGEGADLLAELYSERAERDFLYQKELVEALKPYTVSIFPYQKELLLRAGALHLSPVGIYTLSPGWYGEEGLLDEEQSTLWEV